MTGPRKALRPSSLAAASCMRRLDCTNANACLAVAESRGWPSFACGDGCYAPPDSSQRARDVTGLILLNAVTDAGADDDEPDDNAAVKEVL